MSKQAEAAAITLYKDGLCDWPVSAARVIETAYAEREKAVAELVSAATDAFDYLDEQVQTKQGGNATGEQLELADKLSAAIKGVKS